MTASGVIDKEAKFQKAIIATESIEQNPEFYQFIVLLLAKPLWSFLLQGKRLLTVHL